jgi:hypothetical protein
MIHYKTTPLAVLVGIVLCLSTSVADSPPSHTNATSPAQSSVALNGVFTTVEDGSSSVKTAVSAKDLKAAASLEGKQGVFTGTIAKVYIPGSNSIVVLDFAKDYDTALTAIVKPEAYKVFPDLNKLNGKTIVISGPVTEYHGRPQVVLSELNQIKAVTGKS